MAFLDETGLAYFWQQILAKINAVKVTKTSQLTNDSGFITSTNVMVVNVTGSTADKTYDEIIAAYKSGKVIQCKSNSIIYDLTAVIEAQKALYFASSNGYTTIHRMVCVNNSWSSGLEYLVDTSRTVNGKDLATNITLSADDVGALPSTTTALKNPNAITFTGASTGTYDGSSALTINIPASGADAYTQFAQVAVSLPLSSWTGSTTFTNTISISSIKADTIVIASPAPSDKDVFAFSDIYCSAQAEGSLTFTAKTKPSADLTANLIIVTLPEGATATANTCSLTVAGWSSNTQTVSVEGMAADRIAIIGPTVSSIDVCKTNAVYCSAQGNGTLTFKCQTIPSAAITMNVIMI